MNKIIWLYIFAATLLLINSSFALYYPDNCNGVGTNSTNCLFWNDGTNITGTGGTPSNNAYFKARGTDLTITGDKIITLLSGADSNVGWNVSNGLTTYTLEFTLINYTNTGQMYLGAFSTTPWINENLLFGWTTAGNGVLDVDYPTSTDAFTFEAGKINRITATFDIAVSKTNITVTNSTGASKNATFAYFKPGPASLFTWYGSNGQRTHMTNVTAYIGGIRTVIPPLPPTATNFSITARDFYYGDIINSFSASINGTLYTTTNGRINTTIPNLFAGIFNVYVNSTNYFNQLYSWNVTQNLLANLTNTRAKINITANSKISSASILSYTAVLQSLNSSDSLSYSTTNGSIMAIGKWNETYNLTTDATSYSSNLTTILFNNGSTPNKRIDLYPENTIIATIRDEQTQQIINQSILLSIFSSTYATSYSSSNGTIIANNLTPDTYRLDFSGANYSLKTYYVTVSSDTTTLLDVWLLLNTSSQLTSFTTRDAGTTNIVPNAVLTFTRNINNTFVTVAQKNTGVGGTASVNLQPNAVYNLIITATDYQTKTLQLEIDQTSYTIYLSQNSTLNFNNYIQDITYSILPVSNVISPTTAQNFTFTTSSPAGNINYFSIGTNYSGTTYLSNITGSPAGGTAYFTLNTSGQNRTSITIKYFIMAQNGNLLPINKTYYLYNITPTNNSLQFVFTSIAATVPTFYRVIFAIIISLFIGAGFFVFLGATGSSFVAMFSMLVFAITGFIPFIFALIPCVLIILGYIGFGGDSFT